MPFGFPVGVVEILLCYLGATFKHVRVIGSLGQAIVWIHSVSSSIETPDVEKIGDTIPFLSNPLLIYVIYMFVFLKL